MIVVQPASSAYSERGVSAATESRKPQAESRKPVDTDLSRMPADEPEAPLTPVWEYDEGCQELP